MPYQTMVIYLKDSKVKDWLKQKATNKTKKTGKSQSVSSVVAEILQKEFSKEEIKNPLLNYFGVGKNFEEQDWEEFEKQAEGFRKNWKSKPDSYYDQISINK